MKIKILFILFLLEMVVMACDVPVFRYALERWERDLYKVIVLHRNELNEAHSQFAKQIFDTALVNGGNANYASYRVDLNDLKVTEGFYRSYPGLKTLEVGEEPLIVLLYPNITRVDEPIWTGPLNQQNVDELINSEATLALMKGVLQGYSSTFLLMESGNSQKDEAAALEVQKAIETLKSKLEIPEGVVKTDGQVTGGKLTAYEAASIDPSNVLKSNIPLKIDFHLVRMPANNSNPIFRAILDKTFKSDSGEAEPELFAFFGRGRLLGPMIGEEIIEKHIIQLSTYICSACSCQVKRQNPGIDFLTNLDWLSYVEGSEVVIDKVLPPLIGMIDLAPNKEEEASNLEENLLSKPKPKENLFIRNTIITLGGFFIFIIGASVVMKKK